MTEHETKLNMQGSTCYLFGFMMTIICPSLINGYFGAYENQVTDCFNAKFNWVTDDDKALYNGLLGGAIIFGAGTGAFLGGTLMSYGRRKLMMWAMFLGIIGNSITVVLNVWVIMVGRFIFGFAVGL